MFKPIHLFLSCTLVLLTSMAQAEVPISANKLETMLADALRYDSGLATQVKPFKLICAQVS